VFETGITQLATWQFIVLCLAISGMLKVAAMIIDYFFSKAKFYHLWTELLLPIAPFFVGGTIGRFMTSYPYPEGFASVSMRVLYGMVAGLLSGMVYRFIRKSIQIKVGLSDDTTTPAVSPAAPAVVVPVVPSVESK
jgi:hypothetical protein